MPSDVRFSGPIFDGQAKSEAARAVIAARHKVADAGKELTEGVLTASIRNPGSGRSVRSITTTDTTTAYRTGRYVMPVIVNADETVVTTDLATYGPWLEGTGSQNLTTRFKGYNSFRRAGQILATVAQVIADDAVRPYVQRMN